MMTLFLVCVSTLIASAVVVIALTILDILKARKQLIGKDTQEPTQAVHYTTFVNQGQS